MEVGRKSLGIFSKLEEAGGGISVFLSLLVCCPLPFLRIKLGFVQGKALLFVLEKKNRI